MYRFIKIYAVQYFESNNLMREIYNYLFRKKPPDYSNIYNYMYIQQINLKQTKNEALELLRNLFPKVGL